MRLRMGIAAGVVLLAGCSDDDAEYEARDVCEQFVQDQLKSPSTADFTETVAVADGDEWTVTGSVDSENGFGAMIRNDYTCVVEPGGDQWRLVDLESTEN